MVTMPGTYEVVVSGSQLYYISCSESQRSVVPHYSVRVGRSDVYLTCSYLC